MDIKKLYGFHIEALKSQLETYLRNMERYVKKPKNISDLNYFITKMDAFTFHIGFSFEYNGETYKISEGGELDYTIDDNEWLLNYLSKRLKEEFETCLKN